MARKPIYGVDVEIDEATGAILADLSAAAGGVPAGTPEALGDKTTTGAGWDEDGDELAIPANTLHLHVHCDQDMYLLANNSDDDPATDPAIYAGGVRDTIQCKGMTKLHYKRAGANNATVSVTAFKGE